MTVGVGAEADGIAQVTAVMLHSCLDVVGRVGRLRLD